MVRPSHVLDVHGGIRTVTATPSVVQMSMAVFSTSTATMAVFTTSMAATAVFPTSMAATAVFSTSTAATAVFSAATAEFTLAGGGLLLATHSGAQRFDDGSTDWNSLYPAHKTSKGILGPDGSYVVQKGDSLYGIAKRFRVGQKTLIQRNALGEGGRIVTGQTLFIRTSCSGRTCSARHIV